MDQRSIVDIVIVPDKIFCEMHDEGDACDVTVQMEDGAIYTALFATVPYLQRQMALTYMVTASIPHTPPVRFRRAGYAAYHRRRADASDYRRLHRQPLRAGYIRELFHPRHPGRRG